MVKRRPNDGTCTGGGLCGGTVLKTSSKIDKMALNGGFFIDGGEGRKIGYRSNAEPSSPSSPHKSDKGVSKPPVGSVLIEP